LHGAPDIIHTDNGSQFTSDAFVSSITESGANPRINDKGNVIIKHLNRTLLYDEVRPNVYLTVAKVKRTILRNIEKFNIIRPDASLGSVIPNYTHE